jgi:hypothetical protein
MRPHDCSSTLSAPTAGNELSDIGSSATPRLLSSPPGRGGASCSRRRAGSCLHPDDAPVIIPALGRGQSSQDHHGVPAPLGVLRRVHRPISIGSVRQRRWPSQSESFGGYPLVAV